MIDSIGDYKKKIKLLQQYDELYYDNNSPKITDADYDQLKKQLID